MKTPTISVIIPAYNPRLSVIMECLKSISSSSLKPTEVILVDDCSTLDYLKKVRPYCKVIMSKKNSGPAHARNKGAKIANGNILCFIDSDVKIEKDTLAKIAEKFREKKVTAVQPIYSKHTQTPNFISQYQNLYQYYNFLCIKHEYVDAFASYCVAVRKDAFFEVGGFDESIKNASVEDENLGIALSAKGYNILLVKDIKVEHLAVFSLKSLLKRMFIMGRDKVESMANNPKTRNIDLEKTSHRIGLVISMLIAPLILLATIFAMLPSVWILAVLLAFVFFVVNSQFFSFVHKNKGAVFLLKSIIVYYMVNLSISFGLVKGGLNALLK